MDIDALVARVKASREAKGLKSTYAHGDMFHPTEAHKAFYDFKYELRAKYPTEADVPAADMAKLNRLFKEMRTCHLAK